MKRIRAIILTGALIFGALIPLSATQMVNVDNVIVTTKDDPVSNGILGKVFDEEGNPLPGAGVTIKGTTVGVITDIYGQFQIFPPNNNRNVTLLFSYVGMKPKELVVKGNNTQQVILEWETNMLAEVVATGFQTISRERSTGSAVIVNKEKLDKIQAPNLTDKLEGMTAGLSTYGDKMSIRGTSSFSDDVGTTPLLVVDGQVVIQDLNSINPDDIENITVLKDAASTSLYGVRASNGVIVVTTKRAKGNKPVINISAGFYLTPKPSLDYMHYASTGDIIDYEKEFLLSNPNYLADPQKYFEQKNDYTSSYFGAYTQLERLYYDLQKGTITQTELDNKLNSLRQYDYRKQYRNELERLTFKQDYNISIAKGGDMSNLFFSARYEGDKDKSISSSDDKISLYLKNELNFTKWFKFTYGANMNFGSYESSQSETHGNQFMPYERLRDDNGNLVYQYEKYNYYRAQTINQTEGLKFMGFNALEEINKNISKTNDMYLRFFAHADFKLAKGLDLALKFQYEDTHRDVEQYDEEDSYEMRYMINRFASFDEYGNLIYYIPEGGHMSNAQERYKYFNFRGQLNYQTTIAQKHDISALIGGEIRQDQTKIINSERYGYDSQKLTVKQVDWQTLGTGGGGVTGQLFQTPQTSSERLEVYETLHRYVSAYANVGYTYDTRYSFNGSIRVEQADLFGTDPKYRYRPLWSVGASWNITNEEFMEEYSWLNMLKLRMTYGITGNVDQSSSPYLIGDYLTAPNTNSNLTDIRTPPNRLLRWEKTASFNFGIDFSLFQRLNGSLDVYSRKSSDLLALKSLDPSTGFDIAKTNNGVMKNTGVEMSISYDWLKKGDWGLNTTLTATYNKNKIKEVGYIPTSASNMLTSPYSNYLSGDTYGTIYAYKYAGLNEQGDPSIYDENGKITSNENVDNIKALIRKGQLTPKWQGALNINLRWKSLELFTKFVYYTGHSLRNDVTPLYKEIDATANEDIVNRWTLTNTDTDIPAMGKHGGYESFRNLQWKYADTHVMSASFIKLRNIGISYALPKNIIQNWGFNNLSLRAQVNNPLYWAANKEGIDPEAFNANSGVRIQKQLTSYVLGLNINF